jgi:uncharacterized membrane protein AbrB (regulator of aidB expression)
MKKYSLYITILLLFSLLASQVSADMIMPGEEWVPELLLLALIVTIILESLVIWAFVKGKYPKPLLFSTIVNTITLPIATLILLKVPMHPQAIILNFILIEIGVTIVESFLIMKFLKQTYLRALLISFVANLVSALIGRFAFLVITRGFPFW